MSGSEPAQLSGQYGALEPVSASVGGGNAGDDAADNAQKEGARVLGFLERHSQRVLADHGFEEDGQAPEAVVD